MSIANDLEKNKKPEEIYKKVEQLLLEKHSSSANRSYLSPADMAQLMLDVASERMDEKKRDAEVIFTSYKQLNYASGGFEKGNLIILSAGSGVGKSVFSMNLVRDVAYVSNKPVLYLNSEMTNNQQAMRYDSLLGSVSHQNIRGGVSATEFNRITQAASVFRGKQIHTITIPDMQLSHVVAEIKRMKVRANIEFVVVDYIGRMDITKAFGKDLQEWQIMEQTARQLKNLALELGIVIVMVAQLSGNGQTLAKGSSMKNECDLWLNLKRITNDDIQEYEEATGNEFNRWWNIILEFRKARSAQFGSKIFMHFCGEKMLFTDNEQEAQEMAEGGL
jgi:replicative DNA helicase